jgi:hypothetical protein
MGLHWLHYAIEIVGSLSGRSVQPVFIRFLCCVLPLLQCHCSVMYFCYMKLRSSSRYIPVGMGRHWLECVIGIVEKVKWNTFVLSVTIKSLGISWNSSSKVWSFLCLQTNIFFKSTNYGCGDCQIVFDYG